MRTANSLTLILLLATFFTFALSQQPLIETLRANNLTSLATLLETNGLTGLSNVTLFAPVNSAFSTVPSGVNIVNVLRNHVVGSRVLSSAVTNNLVAQSLANGALRLNVYTGGLVTVNAKVITRVDLLAANGVVIHIINGVLSDIVVSNTVQIAQSLSNFTTLVSLVVAANLATPLSTLQAITVFAPVNPAFARLPAAVVAAVQLPDNLDILQAVLTAHVVNATIVSASLRAGNVATLNPDYSLVVDTTGGVTLGGARPLLVDVVSTNGIIHAIDSVIIPPFTLWANLRLDPDLSAFVTAVRGLGNSNSVLTALNDKTRNLIALAEENSTFSIQEGISAADQLAYHIITGTRTLPTNVQPYSVVRLATLYTNNFVTLTAASNGTLLANGVGLVLGANGLNGPLYYTTERLDVPAGNLVTVLQSLAPTLASAVSAAGLVETLSNPNAYFTVFAPTNAAFNKVNNLTNILKDRARLTQILTIHVISNQAVFALTVPNQGANFTTVSTASIRVVPRAVGATVFAPYSSANIVDNYDVVCTNGVIHFIDTVLLPFPADTSSSLSLISSSSLFSLFLSVVLFFLL